MSVGFDSFLLKFGRENDCRRKFMSLFEWELVFNLRSISSGSSCSFHFIGINCVFSSWIILFRWVSGFHPWEKTLKSPIKRNRLWEQIAFFCLQRKSFVVHQYSSVFLVFVRSSGLFHVIFIGFVSFVIRHWWNGMEFSVKSQECFWKSLKNLQMSLKCLFVTLFLQGSSSRFPSSLVPFQGSILSGILLFLQVPFKSSPLSGFYSFRYPFVCSFQFIFVFSRHSSLRWGRGVLFLFPHSSFGSLFLPPYYPR